jgi:hypothetical protein
MNMFVECVKRIVSFGENATRRISSFNFYTRLYTSRICRSDDTVVKLEFSTLPATQF